MCVCVPRCRPNLAGLTCNEPLENFYGGLLDYLVYEAETAQMDEVGRQGSAAWTGVDNNLLWTLI